MDCIEIKLNRQRIENLYALFYWMSDNWMPETDIEHLWYCHLQAMSYYMGDLIRKGMNKQQNNYTLKITAPEALAWCQFWGGNGLYDLSKRGAVEVQYVMDIIDKVRKNNR